MRQAHDPQETVEHTKDGQIANLVVVRQDRAQLKLWKLPPNHRSDIGTLVLVKAAGILERPFETTGEACLGGYLDGIRADC